MLKLDINFKTFDLFCKLYQWTTIVVECSCICMVLPSQRLQPPPFIEKDNISGLGLSTFTS